MNLTQATDRAIAEENRRFLSDPAAIEAARAEGDVYRVRLEKEGILPALYPGCCPDCRQDPHLGGNPDCETCAAEPVTYTPLELAGYAARGIAMAHETLASGLVPESVLTLDCTFHGVPDFCAWHDHVDANDFLAVGYPEPSDDDSDVQEYAWCEGLAIIGEHVQRALNAVFYGDGGTL